MSDKKLYLIDGNALVYRAHFAFIGRPLMNSKGVNTSAITGFVRTLWDIIQNQRPSHIAVAFDPPGPTFRHEQYPEYKANREETPEDIRIAMPYVRKIVEAFNIPIVEVPNYEADDVIGTLSKQAKDEGFDVFMVTPDKDFAQLVEEKIKIYKPSRKGSGIEIMGVSEILEKFDIERPEQVIDVLGLQGDSVDNIPGVPGIGVKTAIKLLKLYDSVEGLLANTDKLKGKQKENVIKYAEQALLSKELATIKLDVPIQFNEQAYRIENFDSDEIAALFKELEFRSLAHSILGNVENGKPKPRDLFSDVQEPIIRAPKKKEPVYKIVDNNITNTPHQYHLIDTKEGRSELINQLEKQSVFCFDTETTGLNPHEAEMVGIAFAYNKGEAYYVSLPENQDETLGILNEFKKILENPKISKIGQNLKYDMNMLKWYDIHVKGELLDTMIAHYLIEPDLRHNLDFLSETYLKYKMISITSLIGKGKNQLSMRDVNMDKVYEYGAEDADITFQIKDLVFEELKSKNLKKLYFEIEEPLIEVLSAMEVEGVKIDGAFLDNYSKELEHLITDIAQKIYKQADVTFNIKSPKQVGEVLFDRLKINYRWRKTATGQYSTDVDKLTELATENQIVADILTYRMYSKLKSTYVDALPQLINPKTGRIHSNFNQARAATGRLSSDNPNLQNIPIKNDAGREIRKAFVPRDEEHIILAADYSQIELRLIAEISQDEGMLEAFVNDQDFHRATAAKIFEVPYDEVTADQRRTAKTVNFSITYGAGATNLSRQLDIKRSEATEIIEQYFKQFPGLNRYMKEVVEGARKTGYVETLLGRKRELRDINSRSGLTRSNAERMAVNTPIQGTAADMIKVAMINIHQQLIQKNLQTKMIMQVHDELVFDVYKPELEEVTELVENLMKNAIPSLKVPIKIGIDVGDNWLEAH